MKLTITFSEQGIRLCRGILGNGKQSGDKMHDPGACSASRNVSPSPLELGIFVDGGRLLAQLIRLVRTSEEPLTYS